MKKSAGAGIKRKCIQIAAFGFNNFRLDNLITGKLYTGKWKNFCSPGLNCYSCPAAVLSCPIGALQSVGGARGFGASFYVLGFLLAIGAVFGRLMCGFACPFGLLQELFAMAPLKKLRLPKPLTYVKYAVLLIFVLGIPAALALAGRPGVPSFCKYICPAGILEGAIPLLATHESLRGMIGPLFYLKAGILTAVLILCMLIPRFFCKMLCPLGAFYGILARVSLWHLEVDESSCIHCGKCAASCMMDVDPVTTPRSPECVMCGRCSTVCPKGAIHIGFGAGKQTQNNEIKIERR